MSTGDSGSFGYANPRTIHWGAGSLTQHLDREIVDRGLRRAFVVSTKSVSNNPNLAGRLRHILGERDVGEFGAIGQHAPASAVAAAVEAATQAKPDVLISFGGGSTIDATTRVESALATRLAHTEPLSAACATCRRAAPASQQRRSARARL